MVSSGMLKASQKRMKRRGLVRSVDVQAARQRLGLVGDDADDTAVQPREADDDVQGKILVRFEELAVVDDGPDHVLHVVGLVGVVRDDGVQGRGGAAWVIARYRRGRILHVVRGQIGEQPPDLRDAVAVVLAREMGHPAFLVVGLGSAEVLEADLLAGDGLDDLRAGDEHVARVLDHEDVVRHGRRVDRPPAVGPMMAEICGMTPEQAELRKKIWP